MPFLEGLGYGLAMVLFIGPVFFTLLRASLTYGRGGGVAVATGIIVSDILAATICMTGAIKLLNREVEDEWIAVAAGCILLLLGVKYILRPSVDMTKDNRLKTRGVAGLFVSGFMVNFINPFVFVVWLAISIHATNRFKSEGDQWLFLSAVLIGLFSTALLKAVMAERLRRLLAPNVLKWVFISFGIIMIGFSIRAFLFAITE